MVEELFERRMVHLKENEMVILGRKEAQIVIMSAEMALKAEKEFISKQTVKEFIRLEQKLIKSLATRKQIENSPVLQEVRDKIKEMKL